MKITAENAYDAFGFSERFWMDAQQLGEKFNEINEKLMLIYNDGTYVLCEYNSTGKMINAKAIEKEEAHKLFPEIKGI